MNKNIKWIIVIPKAILAASILTIYFLVSMPLGFFVKFSPFKMRKILNIIVAFFCGIMQRALGIKLTVKGDLKLLRLENYFIVANHHSYAEIFPLYAYFRPCFVTSNEMRETPFLGQVSEAAACLFVERRSRDNIQKEIQGVSDGLKNGLNVLVFPEATSHNGDKVHMFRKTLFNGVVYSQTPILPLTLNYTAIDGKSVTKENRDTLFWYGDMKFFPHILYFLSHRRIELEITVHPAIRDIIGKTDIELANMAQAIVAERFKIIV